MDNDLIDVPSKDVPTVKEYERIFERYQTIEKNKDKFPYMEIWKSRWKSLAPDDIGS